MQIFKYPDSRQLQAILQRPPRDEESLARSVSTILQQVKSTGDEALRELTLRFDGVRLDSFKLPENAWAAALDAVPKDLQAAIRLAADNIRTFHAAQREHFSPLETMPGVCCWRKSVPIEKVGLYIPGGSAPLFSTVLMLGIPARLAGCREIVLCTPPGPGGPVNPAILYAAKISGITSVFTLGGAQAIAAMAYGTQTIPRVHKIFGPGNRYVTAAKMLLQQEGLAIDMPAGPSEVLVFADETCVPAFVASDLLAQAEHDADAQVVLLTTSGQVLQAVIDELAVQLPSQPRQKMLQAALANSLAILLDSRETALQAINSYAPEHLILACEDPDILAEQVENAGSVFLGNFTPESAGDYASGTNHTLPTSGFARSYSGVSLDSFVKKITFQQISRQGLASLGPAIVTLASAEQLPAHASSVSLRLQQLAVAEDNPAGPNKPAADPSRLLRPNIRLLKPYSSARSEFQGSASVLMDANENACDLHGDSLNRYPDPLQTALKHKIAVLKGVTPANVFLGNGSDEAIDLLFRLFCVPGLDEVITCPPTYGMYQVQADIHGTPVRQVPLDGQFDLRPEEILRASSARSRLLFLCSPNNPTANLLSTHKIEWLLRRFPGMVVIDEAYADFSDSPSWISRLAEFPNLIVLQTFSKAWALAGLRLGTAFAAPEVINYFNKVKYPYNIGTPAQQRLLQVLEPGRVARQVQRSLAERTRLSAALENSPMVKKVFPSQANFLLVRFEQAAVVFQYLRENGVIVRDRTREPGCADCLRITVGTVAENDRLLHLLRRLE
jgi:histidinol dehydrogenase